MSSGPHIYVNPSCDIIAPMPLEAPLGFINGKSEFGGYESSLPKIILDELVREDGSKIFRVAFEAKHAVGQTQSL